MAVEGTSVLLEDRSAIGEVRRRASKLARALGLDETAVGRVALAAVELSTNAVKHGRGGRMFVSPYAEPGSAAVDLMVADRGPGIADVQQALGDGFSTANTPGTGIGAVRRLSVDFDLFTQTGRGTVVAARVGPDPARVGVRGNGTRADVRGFTAAKEGQEVCGDAWTARWLEGGLQVLVADGLGHGPEAWRAASLAVETLGGSRASAPMTALEEVHAALGQTRGAAAVVAQLEPRRQRLRYAGIGNIAGRLLHGERSQGLVSVNGTAGLVARSLREFDYDTSAGALIILHSDGLTSRWDLAAYPGLVLRSPGVVAGVLLRDFARGRDDVSVVVVRIGEPARP